MVATTTTTKSTTPGLNVTRKPEIREKIARIVALKAIERAAAAAERERRALETEVREAMGAELQIVLRGNVIAKLSSERTSHIYDYDLLRNAFPEAYEAVHSEKKYRFLQVL